MNSSDLNEIRLLNKKDFLIDIIKPHSDFEVTETEVEVA